MIERPERERSAAHPSDAPQGADAESRLAERAHELHVIGALARLAAEAETPEALFGAMLAVLRREEPFDAAIVARGGGVEIELSRPFASDCLDRIAARALEVLGPREPGSEPLVRSSEADDFDPRRDERRDFDPADLVVVPVLRRGRVEACLAFLPGDAAGESRVRLLYSAANHLSLHLDRLLTAREDEAERFRAILDAMPQPVILTGSRLERLHANRSAAALLERLAPEPSAALGLALERLGVGALVARVLGDSRPVADVDATADDGTSFSVSVSPVGRTGRVVIVLTDITESRRIQQRLAQAEKMSSLGQMISGTAHELNNPLASVLGYVQLLQAGEAADPLTERRLASIATEAERCHKIVQNLLAFARHRPPERKPCSVNGTVKSVMALMGYQLRTSGIRLSTELAADLPAVDADEHQLQQVLVNVLTNALHAIRGRRDSGAVLLRTSLAPSGGVVIEVHDDGPGVPAELRSRVFDPFFTTKDETQGTGLGLSIVYGIVAAHGGTVEMLSSELGGACLRLMLPERAAPAVASLPASPEPGTAAAAGSILVVDDEAPLRLMLCEALARDGHRAVAAADGAEALERLAAESFDGIVCDVRMPGMDARRFLDELTRRHPRLRARVLLTSGDTVGREPEELAASAGLDLLHKPFGLEELRERLRRLLGPP